MMTYHSLTQAGASVPAKELLESSEKSSFSGPLSQILNSMENAVISPMPGLVETTEGGSKASGCRCMLWVEHTSILHVLHVPAGRDTNPPPPPRLFTSPSVSYLQQQYGLRLADLMVYSRDPPPCVCHG